MEKTESSLVPKSSARVVAAFLIAPLVFPFLSVTLRFLFWDIDFLGVFFGAGALAGYGFAFVLGIPVFRVFQKPGRDPRYLHYIGFALVCTVIQWVVTGLIMSFSQLLTDYRLWLLTLAFFGASVLSASLFYLIAFTGRK